MKQEIRTALNQKYHFIAPENLLKAIMSGKPVVGADISMNYAFITVVPQNVFIYKRDSCTLEVFTGKNHPDDPRKKNLFINRELHLPKEQEKAKELLQEYIDKFMTRKYSFFYFPNSGEICHINYPPQPILHIVLEEARDWLYDE